MWQCKLSSIRLLTRQRKATSLQAQWKWHPPGAPDNDGDNRLVPVSACGAFHCLRTGNSTLYTLTLFAIRLARHLSVMITVIDCHRSHVRFACARPNDHSSWSCLCVHVGRQFSVWGDLIATKISLGSGGNGQTDIDTQPRQLVWARKTIYLSDQTPSPIRTPLSVTLLTLTTLQICFSTAEQFVVGTFPMNDLHFK